MGQPPPAPSPIIVKFVSLAIRLAFLRNKRASLPAPSAAEIQAGVKRYSVVEDLTSTTYKKMRELADSLEVDKVWSIDGRLRYTVPGDKTIYKVKSVFASFICCVACFLNCVFLLLFFQKFCIASTVL